MSRRRALAIVVIALTAFVAVSAAQSEVHKPGNGVSLPRVTHEVKPEYTREAMQQLIQGTVWMSIVVTEEGDVTDPRITKSLDAEYGLDQAALDAAKQWKFEPGRKDGKPVAVQVTIEMTFTLK